MIIIEKRKTLFLSPFYHDEKEKLHKILKHTEKCIKNKVSQQQQQSQAKQYY